MEMASGSAAGGAASVANGAPAGGSGSLKSLSPMWAKTHSVAASAVELDTATAARLAPFSEKPIETSCPTMPSSGAGAGGPAAAGSGSSGRACSPGRMPVER
eukprot:scaffold2021_cov121-Isochrysis_galbana.AAC.4